ncbi:MAG: sugar phosphate isomerase/epimerase family protein [Candidatus Dormibacteraceae bacterium]
MKPGLFTFQVSDIPFEQLLDAAKACGIQAVELGVTGHTATPGLEVEQLLNDRDRRSDLVKAIGSRGLAISAINATCNPLHPNLELRELTLTGLRAAMKLAAELGVNRVVTGAGCPGESAQSRRAAWVMYSEGAAEVLRWQWEEVAAPVWQELAAYAKDLGIRICIEVHPGTLAYNTDSFLRLRSMAGEAIGANFDPSHLLWQGMDPRVVAAALSGCIYHAHAKDTVINQAAVDRNGVIESRAMDDWKERSWSFCAMGDGHDAVFWRSVVNSLRAAGYDDVWSIEHEDATIGSLEAIKRNARFVQAVL